MTFDDIISLLRSGSKYSVDGFHKEVYRRLGKEFPSFINDFEKASQYDNCFTTIDKEGFPTGFEVLQPVLDAHIRIQLPAIYLYCIRDYPLDDILDSRLPEVVKHLARG
jgi:hypothetical protein